MPCVMKKVKLIFLFSLCLFVFFMCYSTNAKYSIDVKIGKFLIYHKNDLKDLNLFQRGDLLDSWVKLGLSFSTTLNVKFMSKMIDIVVEKNPYGKLDLAVGFMYKECKIRFFVIDSADFLDYSYYNRPKSSISIRYYNLDMNSVFGDLLKKRSGYTVSHNFERR